MCYTKTNCNIELQALGCFYDFYTQQEVRPFFDEEILKHTSEKKISMNWDKVM